MVFFLMPLTAKNGHTSNFEASNESNSRSDLKIITWNIFMLPSFITKTDIAKRSIAIAEYIYESDFDIILFQEAFSEISRDIIYSFVCEKYPYAFGPANKSFSKLRLNSGLWVLSRIPLKFVGQIEFRRASGFDRLAKKGAMMLEGDCNGMRFQIVNTHLNAGNNQSVRVKQYNQLRSELLDRYKRENVIQIIGGDFNINKYETHSYKNMLKDLNVVDDYSMPQYSYHCGLNDLINMPNKKPTLIDYIFLRNHLLKNIHIKTNVLKVKKKWSDKYQDLSDHYPVSAILRFEMTTSRFLAESELRNLN